ncbi:hypothetical protein I6L24_08880 [Acinetobacter lwoffii]|uniref:hypothetical protein n=1 Tax=Acinetobacter lwoffii TaxID=28090 RepID=UPI001C22CCDC|nr:hypothetical protein [Acinetobacter lwoffii]QXB84929.1 hypothetical protein I6L24_08880 [Acinetobacter lwoffii]
MKYITLTTLLLSLAFVGCQKQLNEDIDPITTTTALENSDNILSKYIEKLDSEFTTQDARVKILCRDYPREYKKNYMPNLLKLSPGEYSEVALLADMDLVLDHYKEKDAIQC